MSNKIIKIITIISIIILLIIIGLQQNGYSKELNVSIAKTFDSAPGANQPSGKNVYKIDISKTFYERQILTSLTDKLKFEADGYISIIDSDDILPGVGINGNWVYYFTKDLSIFSGIGLIKIYNAEKVSGLGKSFVHESAQIGIRYLWVTGSWQHLSAIEKHGEDEDFGTNFYKIKVNVPINFTKLFRKIFN